MEKSCLNCKHKNESGFICAECRRTKDVKNCIYYKNWEQEEPNEEYERGRKAGIEEFKEWLLIGFDKTKRLNEMDEKNAPAGAKVVHRMISDVMEENIKYVDAIAKQMLDGTLPRIPSEDR